MEIQDIKATLTISQVIDHYGHKAPGTSPGTSNTNFMLRCPFHEDKTPSMQIYPKTNTFCCFSSNCEAGSGDVIDFIQLKEKGTKHEAIQKAKSLLGYTPEPIGEVPAHAGEKSIAELFTSFKTALKKSVKAKPYLSSRNLDYNKLEIGFNGRTWERMQNCVIFPIKDKGNNIINLYGRSIGGKQHYYLPGAHKGLYPCYPSKEAETIILTESIIDAATLLQNGHENVLALYGTNGFTEDHNEALSQLKNLKEIILFLDGDEAGRKAIVKLAGQLQDLLPPSQSSGQAKTEISYVNTPDEEDVNSLSQSHSPDVFTHLLENRITIPRQKTTEAERITKPNAAGIFNSDNAHKLTYVTSASMGSGARYYIKGGLRHELDRLQVSLLIEVKETSSHYHRYRNRLDLYENKQLERIAREAAEKLSLRADLVELDLLRLTDHLEDYRESQIDNKQGAAKQVMLDSSVSSQCQTFLSAPDVMGRLNELIGKAGVVGEENNRIFLFCIASSYKMPDTLHALIQGSSGSGKTHLLVKVSSFIPQEDIKRFTRVTESSFYNYGTYELQNKLICLEDLDGMKEEAQLAFRELQSREMLSSSTSGQDEKGNIRSFEKIVYGPIASLACTTKGEIYEDNMGRCFLIAVDETKAQTRRVISYQNRKASGKLNGGQEVKITSFVQNCIRMLKSYQVVNTYADQVQLPEEAHKIRRLNELYQSFVKQVTLINQYRRKKDKQGRLITEKEDLQVAAEIMFDSIVLKIDELDGSLRLFYENLKSYVLGKGGDTYETYSFTQREIRQILQVSKTQLQRYIRDLLDLEYIKVIGGHINRGFRYKIDYWDNIQKIRGKVKRHLQVQLDQLELAEV